MLRILTWWVSRSSSAPVSRIASVAAVARSLWRHARSMLRGSRRRRPRPPTRLRAVTRHDRRGEPRRTPALPGHGLHRAGPRDLLHRPAGGLRRSRTSVVEARRVGRTIACEVTEPCSLPRVAALAETQKGLVPPKRNRAKSWERIGFGRGHRHSNTTDSTSSKKPEPPHAPPPPETAAQHKAYLNRYGFGQ